MESNNNLDVSIIGTGDFARTFAKKLATHGFNVTVGSRFPKHRNFTLRDPAFAELGNVKIVSIPECIQASDVIFLAVHAENVNSLFKYRADLSEKVLVDVSNVENGRSSAEHLAQVFGDQHVVKAFNTISAYELDHDEHSLSSDRKVYISGNGLNAKLKVEAIAKNAGFNPMFYGGLENAAKVEESQTAFWQGWGSPVFLSTASFVAWGCYGTMRYQIWKGNPWSMWPVNTLNKVFACAALTNLALCYLPGSIGAGIQLVAGSKHYPFPRWLDSWLKMRKQLGLISLFMASTHMVLSVAHLSAPYFPNWYDLKEVVIPAHNSADVVVPIGVRMNAWGESVISAGSVALGVMAVLGLTSIPSVGSSMNWKQWNFVHTNLGYTCLAVASTHVFLKGLKDWLKKPLIESSKGMAFLSLVIPVLAMTTKSFLSLPGISGYLSKIRKGWERGRNNDEITQ